PKTFDWQEKLRHTKWNLATPTILIVGSCVFFIAAAVSISGYNAYQSAQISLQETTAQQALNEIDKAIKRGGHPEYSNFKLQLLNHVYEQTYEEQYATEAQQTLDGVNKKEPYYEKFIHRQVELNTLLHNDEASAVLLQASLSKFP